MPKVKLFSIERYYDDDYSDEKLGVGITDWEEVSKEDIKLLRQYPHYEERPFVVVEQLSAPEVIQTIIERLSKRKREQEEAAAKREAKRAEADRKKLLRQQKEERTAYERLKAKFEK